MSVKISAREHIVRRIPEVGEVLHFFDDGKMGRSRHYMATVLRVVSCDDAKNILVKKRFWDPDPYSMDSELIDTALTDVWEIEKMEADWVFDEQTDYFIECSVPDYDENNLWFVRTKDGGWFSMDIQSGWQGGRLDTDGEMYKYYKELWKDYEKD